MVISLYVQPICATQPNLKIDTSVKVNRCRRDALHVDGRRLGLPVRRSGVALRRGIPGQASFVRSAAIDRGEWDEVQRFRE